MKIKRENGRITFTNTFNNTCTSETKLLVLIAEEKNVFLDDCFFQGGSSIMFLNKLSHRVPLKEFDPSKINKERAINLVESLSKEVDIFIEAIKKDSEKDFEVEVTL